MTINKKARREVSELKAHIGYWVRIVSNNVSHAFANKLESSSVTVAEWVILREMYGVEEETSSCVIAELTGLTRGAVSKLISRLWEKGLLTRKESCEDRRYQEIKLTPQGRAMVPQLAALADQNDEEFFSVITKAEQKTLLNILIKTAKLHKFNKMPIE